MLLEIQQSDFWNCVWDAVLGQKGQTAAAWIYTVVTSLLLFFVIRQIRQVENQLSVMRASRDLESFNSFMRLWEDSDVRDARKHVYDFFGQALRKKEPLERQLAFEKAIADASGPARQAIDLVISKSNLVGLLWTEGFLSESMRKVVLPYIYKTVMLTWACLEPYIQYVRKQRQEKSPNSITYAAPFESLWKEADGLRLLRKEEIPSPPASV